MTEPTRIRVLIVDDHSVVRMGLRMFFELQHDIEVVGEATDGSEGVAMARRLEPDVVLMDLLMPNMDGVTAIGRIKAERPETEIVTMTSFIEEEQVTAALEAGASGYVLKDAEAEEVAAAVRAAYNGEVHLDPAVARLLAQRMRNKTPHGGFARRAADRSREGRPQPARAGDEQQGDRHRAVHHRADRADLRLEHPGQARAGVPDAGRAVRGRAQAGRAAEVGARATRVRRPARLARSRGSGSAASPAGVATTDVVARSRPDQRPARPATTTTRSGRGPGPIRRPRRSCRRRSRRRRRRSRPTRARPASRPPAPRR